MRYRPKAFEVWHPNGSGWLRGLGGAELVPYRLPQLTAADAGATVFIGEGEKVADRLASAGLIATTSPFGAGKWPAAWGERYLRDRRVVVLPDADEVGAKHARAVADSVSGHAASVRIVELPELLEHGDVVDWLDAGHAVAELLALAAQAPEYRRPAVTRTEHGCTDLANSERLVERHAADLRYVDATRQWHVWDGRRWRTDDTGEIERRAKDTARAIYREAEAATSAARRKELASHAVRSEAASKIAAMITLAQSDARVALRADDLDAEPWLLNVSNGTIDLRSGALRPHRREDLVTKLAPVAYDAEARLELFDAFLFQTFGGDAELIRYVQKAAGYGLCGDTREEVIFIAHGPTGGGKTTLAEALRAALGDYAATADPETFLVSHRDGGAPRADIARLHGRRLVVGVEVDQGRHMAEGLVKQLTGGDTVVARHLYRDHFEFRPQFKLWIFANDAPRVRDDDDAVWRRLRLVPFTHPVPREQRDPQLKLTLRDPKVGGPAVLAWAVAGCLLWQREGLGMPPVIDVATRGYREAQDPVADFVAECCVVEAGAWATVEELYAAYAAWAKAAGERRPLAKRGFSNRLDRHGFPAAKGAKGVRIRQGIGLREQQRLVTAGDRQDDAILEDEPDSELPL
ncbi:MAG TPA: phage/plasmid primase, P4 family [Candidatus Limnocylindria bacterium]|nr:phage/plasmid primase, P4 family [Candidatus Limnocylindria bacterium]